MGYPKKIWILINSHVYVLLGEVLVLKQEPSFRTLSGRHAPHVSKHLPFPEKREENAALHGHHQTEGVRGRGPATHRVLDPSRERRRQEHADRPLRRGGRRRDPRRSLDDPPEDVPARLERVVPHRGALRTDPGPDGLPRRGHPSGRLRGQL